ncbi:MAG: hypothetical protein EOO41_00100 [Methanobacteriota archaeon]|nr:MAG: hypothetical protein EOO41_00100 [Euryarchaeota archaeon]
MAARCRAATLPRTQAVPLDKLRAVPDVSKRSRMPSTRPFEFTTNAPEPAAWCPYAGVGLAPSLHHACSVSTAAHARTRSRGNAAAGDAGSCARNNAPPATYT